MSTNNGTTPTSTSPTTNPQQPTLPSKYTKPIAKFTKRDPTTNPPSTTTTSSTPIISSTNSTILQTPSTTNPPTTTIPSQVKARTSKPPKSKPIKPTPTAAVTTPNTNSATTTSPTTLTKPPKLPKVIAPKPPKPSKQLQSTQLPPPQQSQQSPSTIIPTPPIVKQIDKKKPVAKFAPKAPQPPQPLVPSIPSPQPSIQLSSLSTLQPQNVQPFFPQPSSTSLPSQYIPQQPPNPYQNPQFNPQSSQSQKSSQPINYQNPQPSTQQAQSIQYAYPSDTKLQLYDKSLPDLLDASILLVLQQINKTGQVTKATIETMLGFFILTPTIASLQLPLPKTAREIVHKIGLTGRLPIDSKSKGPKNNRIMSIFKMKIKWNFALRKKLGALLGLSAAYPQYNAAITSYENQTLGNNGPQNNNNDNQKQDGKDNKNKNDKNSTLSQQSIKSKELNHNNKLHGVIDATLSLPSMQILSKLMLQYHPHFHFPLFSTRRVDPDSDDIEKSQQYRVTGVRYSISSDLTDYAEFAKDLRLLHQDRLIAVRAQFNQIQQQHAKIKQSIGLSKLNNSNTTTVTAPTQAELQQKALLQQLQAFDANVRHHNEQTREAEDISLLSSDLFINPHVCSNNCPIDQQHMNEINSLGDKAHPNLIKKVCYKKYADEITREWSPSPKDLENDKSLVIHSKQRLEKLIQEAHQAKIDKADELQNKKTNYRKQQSTTYTPFREKHSIPNDPVVLNLPVRTQATRVLHALHHNNVIVVVGQTGSGKSTQIPQLLYEHFHQCDICKASHGQEQSNVKKVDKYGKIIQPKSQNKFMDARILCTQPRRLAAISLAQRVADERGELQHAIDEKQLAQKKLKEQQKMIKTGAGGGDWLDESAIDQNNIDGNNVMEFVGVDDENMDELHIYDSDGVDDLIDSDDDTNNGLIADGDDHNDSDFELDEDVEFDDDNTQQQQPQHNTQQQQQQQQQQNNNKDDDNGRMQIKSTSSVGYAVKGQVRNPHSNIVYCTSGLFLRRLTMDPNAQTRHYDNKHRRVTNLENFLALEHFNPLYTKWMRCHAETVLELNNIALRQEVEKRTKLLNDKIDELPSNLVPNMNQDSNTTSSDDEQFVHDTHNNKGQRSWADPDSDDDNDNDLFYSPANSSDDEGGMTIFGSTTTNTKSTQSKSLTTTSNDMTTQSQLQSQLEITNTKNKLKALSNKAMGLFTSVYSPFIHRLLFALRKYTHIIIDEAHERDKLTDFTLVLLKVALMVRKDLKVIIMSATINSTLFSDYFSAPIINIEGRTFPVDVFHMHHSVLLAEMALSGTHNSLYFMNSKSDANQYQQFATFTENAHQYINAVIRTQYEQLNSTQIKMNDDDNNDTNTKSTSTTTTKSNTKSNDKQPSITDFSSEFTSYFKCANNRQYTVDMLTKSITTINLGVVSDNITLLNPGPNKQCGPLCPCYLSLFPLSTCVNVAVTCYQVNKNVKVSGGNNKKSGKDNKGGKDDKNTKKGNSNPSNDDELITEELLDTTQLSIKPPANRVQDTFRVLEGLLLYLTNREVDTYVLDKCLRGIVLGSQAADEQEKKDIVRITAHNQLMNEQRELEKLQFEQEKKLTECNFQETGSLDELSALLGDLDITTTTTSSTSHKKSTTTATTSTTNIHNNPLSTNLNITTISNDTFVMSTVTPPSVINNGTVSISTTTTQKIPVQQPQQQSLPSFASALVTAPTTQVQPKATLTSLTSLNKPTTTTTTPTPSNIIQPPQQPLFNSNQNTPQQQQHPSVQRKATDLLAMPREQLPFGSILIFVAGWSDITTISEFLLKHSIFGSDKYSVIPLHSTVPLDQQQLAFELPQVRFNNDKIYDSDEIKAHYQSLTSSTNDGTNPQSSLLPIEPQWKIIVSTNIAETSLTIADCMYVFDFGCHKEKIYNAAADYSTFGSTFISQSNCEQRRGRAGRVRHGYCFRFYDVPTYYSFPQFPKPEVLTTSIEDLVLSTTLLTLTNANISRDASSSYNDKDGGNNEEKIMKQKSYIKKELLTKYKSYLKRLSLYQQQQYDLFGTSSVKSFIRIKRTIDSSSLLTHNTTENERYRCVQFLSLMPQPPPLTHVIKAIHSLQQVNALDSFEHPTALSTLFNTLPLPPRLSRLLMLSLLFGCFDHALTAVSILTSPPVFVGRPTGETITFNSKNASTPSQFPDSIQYDNEGVMISHFTRVANAANTDNQDGTDANQNDTTTTTTSTTDLSCFVPITIIRKLFAQSTGSDVIATMHGFYSWLASGQVFSDRRLFARSVGIAHSACTTIAQTRRQLFDLLNQHPIFKTYIQSSYISNDYYHQLTFGGPSYIASLPETQLPQQPIVMMDSFSKLIIFVPLPKGMAAPPKPPRHDRFATRIAPPTGYMSYSPPYYQDSKEMIEQLPHIILSTTNTSDFKRAVSLFDPTHFRLQSYLEPDVVLTTNTHPVTGVTTTTKNPKPIKYRPLCQINAQNLSLFCGILTTGQSFSLRSSFNIMQNGIRNPYSLQQVYFPTVPSTIAPEDQSDPFATTAPYFTNDVLNYTHQLTPLRERIEQDETSFDINSLILEHPYYDSLPEHSLFAKKPIRPHNSVITMSGVNATMKGLLTLTQAGTNGSEVKLYKDMNVGSLEVLDINVLNLETINKTIDLPVTPLYNQPLSMMKNTLLPFIAYNECISYQGMTRLVDCTPFHPLYFLFHNPNLSQIKHNYNVFYSRPFYTMVLLSNYFHQNQLYAIYRHMVGKSNPQLFSKLYHWDAIAMRNGLPYFPTQKNTTTTTTTTTTSATPITSAIRSSTSSTDQFDYDGPILPQQFSGQKPPSSQQLLAQYIEYRKKISYLYTQHSRIGNFLFNNPITATNPSVTNQPLTQIQKDSLPKPTMHLISYLSRHFAPLTSTEDEIQLRSQNFASAIDNYTTMDKMGTNNKYIIGDEPNQVNSITKAIQDSILWMCITLLHRIHLYTSSTTPPTSNKYQKENSITTYQKGENQRIWLKRIKVASPSICSILNPTLTLQCDELQQIEDDYNNALNAANDSDEEHLNRPPVPILNTFDPNVQPEATLSLHVRFNIDKKSIFDLLYSETSNNRPSSQPRRQNSHCELLPPWISNQAQIKVDSKVNIDPKTNRFQITFDQIYKLIQRAILSTLYSDLFNTSSQMPQLLSNSLLGLSSLQQIYTTDLLQTNLTRLTQAALVPINFFGFKSSTNTQRHYNHYLLTQLSAGIANATNADIVHNSYYHYMMQILLGDNNNSSSLRLPPPNKITTLLSKKTTTHELKLICDTIIAFDNYRSKDNHALYPLINSANIPSVSTTTNTKTAATSYQQQQSWGEYLEQTSGGYSPYYNSTVGLDTEQTRIKQQLPLSLADYSHKLFVSTFDEKMNLPLSFPPPQQQLHPTPNPIPSARTAKLDSRNDQLKNAILGRK